MNIIWPNEHAIAVLLLTLVALILFTREKIPLETTSLIIMVALTIGFTLFPFTTKGETLNVSDFFQGFGHKALVAVCALMILGSGLVRTGALEPVGRFLARLWRRGPLMSLLATLLMTAFLSAFINNTPIVVLMLPILIGVAVRNNASPTGTLLPMGLASLVGGMATTIGTSTNLLVVTVAEDMGVAPFQMFDFLIPVALAGTVAILYLWLIAPKLLPERKIPLESTSSRLFSAQIELNESSPVVGLPLSNAKEKAEGRLKITKIQRGPGVFISPLPDVVLKAGDRLTMSETPDRLREISVLLGGTLYSGKYIVDDEHPLGESGLKLAEVAITMGSRLMGARLTQARLMSRFGLQFLALHRAESKIKRDVDAIILRAGDVLLVQAKPENLAKARVSGDFLVLDGSSELPHTKKAPLTLMTLIAVIIFAAVGVVPIEVSAVAGCLVLIVTRCISWRDATNALSAQVILIVAASLALGVALMRTGGADFLAQLFISATYGFPAPVVLGGMMLLIGLMTNIISNNAAAVIGTPIAIQIATRLGLPVEPFVLAVLFGANLSFATPMAYQTNLLVMNAGGYKFNDFLRVGIPLMLLMWFTLTGILVYAYRL